MINTELTEINHIMDNYVYEFNNNFKNVLVGLSNVLRGNRKTRIVFMYFDILNNKIKFKLDKKKINKNASCFVTEIKFYHLDFSDKDVRKFLYNGNCSEKLYDILYNTLNNSFNNSIEKYNQFIFSDDKSYQSIISFFYSGKISITDLISVNQKLIVQVLMLISKDNRYLQFPEIKFQYERFLQNNDPKKILDIGTFNYYNINEQRKIYWLKNNMENINLKYLYFINIIFKNYFYIVDDLNKELKDINLLPDNYLMQLLNDTCIETIPYIKIVELIYKKTKFNMKFNNVIDSVMTRFDDYLINKSEFCLSRTNFYINDLNLLFWHFKESKLKYIYNLLSKMNSYNNIYVNNLNKYLLFFDEYKNNVSLENKEYIENIILELKKTSDNVYINQNRKFSILR